MNHLYCERFPRRFSRSNEKSPKFGKIAIYADPPGLSGLNLWS